MGGFFTAGEQISVSSSAKKGWVHGFSTSTKRGGVVHPLL